MNNNVPAFVNCTLNMHVIGKLDPIKFLERGYSGQVCEQMKDIFYSLNSENGELNFKILENEKVLNALSTSYLKMLVYADSVFISTSSLKDSSSDMVVCHHLSTHPQFFIYRNLEKEFTSFNLNKKILPDRLECIKNTDPEAYLKITKELQKVDSFGDEKLDPEHFSAILKLAARIYHPITLSSSGSLYQVADIDSTLLPKDMIDVSSESAVSLDTQFRKNILENGKSQYVLYGFVSVSNIDGRQPPMILNSSYWKDLFDRVYNHRHLLKRT